MSTIKIPAEWRDEFGVDYLEGFTGTVDELASILSAYGEEHIGTGGASPTYAVSFDGKVYTDPEALLVYLAETGADPKDIMGRISTMVDPETTNSEPVRKIITGDDDGGGGGLMDAIGGVAHFANPLSGGLAVAGAVTEFATERLGLPQGGEPEGEEGLLGQLGGAIGAGIGATAARGVELGPSVRPSEGQFSPEVQAALDQIGTNPFGLAEQDVAFGPIFGAVKADDIVLTRRSQPDHLARGYQTIRQQVGDREAEVYELERGRGGALEKRQLQMFAAGMYGDITFDQIEWGQPDEATISAWKNTLIRAVRETYAGSDQTISDLLEEMSSPTRVRDQIHDEDVEIQVPAIEDLRMGIQSAFTRVGRQPSAAEEQLIINTYLESARNAAPAGVVDPRLQASQTLAGGGTMYGHEAAGDAAGDDITHTPPSIEATAAEFIDENLQGQENRRQAIGYYDVFQGMLGGGP